MPSNTSYMQNDEPVSPCISICVMDDATGYCQGCARTIDEIASWGSMPRDDKQAVLDQLDARMAELTEPEKPVRDSDGA